MTSQHRPRQFTDVNALIELSDSTHKRERRDDGNEERAEIHRSRARRWDPKPAV